MTGGSEFVLECVVVTRQTCGWLVVSMLQVQFCVDA